MASPILSLTCCEVRNNILSLIPSGDKNTLKSYDPEGGQILLFGPDFKVVIPWESWQWVRMVILLPSRTESPRGLTWIKSRYDYTSKWTHKIKSDTGLEGWLSNEECVLLLQKV